MEMNLCDASDKQDGAGAGGMLVLGGDRQGRILGLLFSFLKTLFACVGQKWRSKAIFVESILVFHEVCQASAFTSSCLPLIQILPREEVRLFLKTVSLMSLDPLASTQRDLPSPAS